MEKCLDEIVQQARQEEHLNSKAFASLLEAQVMAAGMSTELQRSETSFFAEIPGHEPNLCQHLNLIGAANVGFDTTHTAATQYHNTEA